MIDSVASAIFGTRTRVEDVIFDLSLRLSDVSSSKLFVLIENCEGSRRCCGSDELVEAYVKGLLFPMEGEKEMQLRQSRDYLSERPLPARAPYRKEDRCHWEIWNHDLPHWRQLHRYLKKRKREGRRVEAGAIIKYDSDTHRPLSLLFMKFIFINCEN